MKFCTINCWHIFKIPWITHIKWCFDSISMIQCLTGYLVDSCLHEALLHSFDVFVVLSKCTSCTKRLPAYFPGKSWNGECSGCDIWTTSYWQCCFCVILQPTCTEYNSGHKRTWYCPSFTAVLSSFLAKDVPSLPKRGNLLRPRLTWVSLY